METKSVELVSSYVKNGNSFEWKLLPNNAKNNDVRFHLEMNCGGGSAFYAPVKEGELVMQEFFPDNNEKFYFDINSEGELIGILPEGFDGQIDSNGRLMIGCE